MLPRIIELHFVGFILLKLLFTLENGPIPQKKNWKKIFSIIIVQIAAHEISINKN